MTKFQLSYLRLLGVAEGLSLLFILLVAMPVRKILQDPSLVQIGGAIHGLLFLMYCYTLVDSTPAGKWGLKNLILGLVASCLPFGTFWFDRKILKDVPVTTPNNMR